MLKGLAAWLHEVIGGFFSREPVRLALATGLASIGAGYTLVRLLLPGTARLGLLVPLGLLLLWFAWRSTRPPRVVAALLGLPLLLCSAALTISSLGGVAPPPAVVAELFHWVSAGVLLFLAIDLLASGWQPAIFIRAVLLTVSVALLASSWMVADWWIGWVQLWEEGERLLPVGFRPLLANQHPNQHALLLNLGVPLVLAALWRAEAYWLRLVWGIWLLLAVVVLFYTSSRGGWLASASVTTIMLGPLLWSAWRVRNWRRIRTTLLLAGGYALIFGLLLLFNLRAVQAQRGLGPNVVDGDGATIGQTASNLLNPTGRDIFWGHALDFFAARPLFGVGPEGFTTLYSAVEPEDRFFQPPHAHNIYLTILSELGTTGALALASLALVGLFVWGRAWLRAGWQAGPEPVLIRFDRRLDMLACGAAGAGLAVHGLVDVPNIWIMGLALVVVAVGLGAGGAWSLGPAVPHPMRPPWLRGWSLAAHPLHAMLVVAALVAWGSSSLVLWQRNQQEAFNASALATAARGELAEALTLYNESIRRYPWNATAYSGGATVQAGLALRDADLLPQALATQQSLTVYDPSNQFVVLNQGALLLAMGDYAGVEAAAQRALAGRGERWPEPYLLLALRHEAAGDTVGARAAWEQMLRFAPGLAESAACLQSRVCADLPPRAATAYAALLQAQELAAVPDAAALRQIEDLASYWQNVDIWAVGALAAERAENQSAARRFLRAARNVAATIGKDPTPHLALAELQAATRRGDEQAIRDLVTKWARLPDARIVPQLGYLLVTATDDRLAAALVDAASSLDDPRLVATAKAYQQRIRAAFLYSKLLR